MATVFVFPSFGAAVGAPADPAVDETASERNPRVAVPDPGEDDEAA
jgi:hypothetical protein